jgi:hypothetical protein
MPLDVAANGYNLPVPTPATKVGVIEIAGEAGVGGGSFGFLHPEKENARNAMIKAQ